MTPKRRSVFSLIFIVICISKFNLISSYLVSKNKFVDSDFIFLAHVAVSTKITSEVLLSTKG